MSRALSADFRKAIFAQESGVVPILLLTVTHPMLAAPIRVSTDATQRLSPTTDAEVVYGTVSNGVEYVFYPLRLTLPEDGEDGPGAMKVEIDNVHRTLTATLRSLTSPPAVNVDIVSSESVDLIEASWPEFLLVHATYDATIISGTLVVESLTREPFPAGSFDPGRFPGLF